MKAFNFFIFIMAVLSNVALASTDTALVRVTKVFSPYGFDTNDDTQVIVAGYLPSLCYKSPRAVATVTGDKVDIAVKAIFNQAGASAFCADVIVPFLETVSVGVLNKGDYKIVVNAGSDYEMHSDIDVMEAMSSKIDNYVYAIIESVTRVEGTNKVIFKGYSPNECFQFDRLEFISNGKDTFSVLPIMKQVSASCEQTWPVKKVYFETVATVPNTLKESEILLHVRVMDGKSLNVLYQNQ